MSSSPVASRFSGGVVWMLAASVLFVGMTAFVKLARADLSTLDVMLWRAAFALPITATVALITTGRRGGDGVVGRFRGAFGVVDRRALVVRCIFGFCAMFSYFTAARGLSVADLTFVMRLQPVLVGLLAPVVLGSAERVGRGVWVAGAVGLLGCAVLLAPGLTLVDGAPQVWALWAFAATVFSAAAHTMLRRLGASDRAGAVVFWFQASCAAVALLLLAFGPGFAAISAEMWPLLAGAGAFSALGQLCLTRAYQRERAAVVSAAASVGPLFAVAVDLWAFDLVPGWPVWVGGALIVGSGLVLALRR